MPKSEVARAMDLIQKRLAPDLKARRFGMRGRTFNRKSSDGLTHVRSVQMGSFDPPGTTYHPRLRENLYGRFTVNLGVYVPEVAAALYGGGAAGNWVRESSCCIRARLGELGNERADIGGQSIKATLRSRTCCRAFRTIRCSSSSVMSLAILFCPN